MPNRSRNGIDPRLPGIVALMGVVVILLVLGWGRISDANDRADAAEARVERLRERVNQLERFIEELGLEAPISPGQSSGGQQSPTSPTGGQQPASEQDGGPGPGQQDEKDDTETGGGGGPPGGTPPPSPSPSPPPEDEPPIDICERLPEVCEL